MTTITIIALLIILGIYAYMYYRLKRKYTQVLQEKQISDIAVNAMKEIEDIDEADNLSNINTVKESLKAFTPIAPFAAYYERRHIQTIPERKVYEALLRIAADYHVNVLPQVPYPCLVSSKPNPKFDTINFLRIAKKRVDFAITDKRGVTQFIIEVDGNSHYTSKTKYTNEDNNVQQKKDIDRDEFLRNCKIPTLRIPVSKIVKDTTENPPYILYSKVEDYIKQNSTIMNLLNQCKERQEIFLAQHNYKSY